ncbi:DUF4873 domain-containing protein [Nocardia sp. XZ_19_385]|uniref:DUF4873 domain-containing protein n=1 Tax=Nocardia sp. XZ_19_385 TaxID=2769488 RepID=UPI001E3BA43B|nr:DUF4873 domain-containing protein [Nocardia sp. XZ_19_385]
MGDPDLVVIDSLGVAEELCTADLGDVLLLSAVTRLEFDATDDRWEVHAADGRRYRPRAVVLESAARPTVLANGCTLPQDWSATTFLSVAAHGFPNLFLHSASAAEAKRRTRYIRRCLELLYRTSSTRIEVRAATQHEYLRRATHPRAATWRRHALRRPDPHHYDLTVPADREPAHDYSGPATLDAPGILLPVHVTLSGHPDPIDGHYHWYGRISATDDLPDPGRAEVLLTVPDGQPTPARLQERDPWGNLRIVGTGTPPFQLDEV